jgi:glycosyltransferase involved in cell wall biosynthesis
MSASAIRGLTSIIIPCWSQLEFTKQCLAALKEHTRPSWELIVIDNGSTDGTAIYLDGARDMAAVPVTVVSNATNLGFPAAINQGLQLARGDHLVLLNNDVVVTDGWLDQLIALADASPSHSRLREGTASEAAALAPLPFENARIGSAETTPRPADGPERNFAETTPPGPPFATAILSPQLIIRLNGAGTTAPFFCAVIV